MKSLLVVPALFIGLFASSTVFARADEDSKTGIIPLLRSMNEEDSSSVRTRNAGVVEGRVLSVDRARGLLTIQSARGRFYDVLVLPSTNIRGHDSDFHTIADLERGQRVRIFMSQRDGVYFAQIIHLHTDH